MENLSTFEVAVKLKNGGCSESEVKILTKKLIDDVSDGIITHNVVDEASDNKVTMKIDLSPSGVYSFVSGYNTSLIDGEPFQVPVVKVDYFKSTLTVLHYDQYENSSNFVFEPSTI